MARKWWGVTLWAAVRDGREWRAFPEALSYGDMRVMKRRNQPAQDSQAEHLAALESSVFGKLHALVAHCACTKYDDKSERKPGWFTVKTIGAAWVVEVKDPDTCCRLQIVQPTLDDALLTAALMLESDQAPWESDPWLKKQQATQKTKK